MKGWLVMLIGVPLFFVSFFAQGADFGDANRQNERDDMVTTQIAARGITNQNVLAAMQKVPRHQFVPKNMERFAYDDNPLSIGHNQTISQPYIVALMTELARLKPGDKVLEIGTGSGYQAAILAELASEVFSVDIIKSLADEARERLNRLGYKNIFVRNSDGYKGWPDEAPFDAIIVTAAPPEIPAELIRQLKPGGRMVVPVGTLAQDLVIITKNNDGTTTEEHHIPVRFVPMVHQKKS